MDIPLMISKLEELQQIVINYNELKIKCVELETENNELKSKLQTSTDECSNLNKVSFVRSLSKEIDDKNKHIKMLESQLEKLKNIKKEVNIVSNDEHKPEHKSISNEFNEEEFNEIDGFELIMYKKNYYLKNTNNEIFNIVNYKPNVIVGTINSKGKIKLN
jgi:predicted  nucleic acid-binding Zn-ribbon protein